MRLNLTHWLYLIILGFITALLISVCDKMVSYVLRYKRRLVFEYGLDYISGFVLLLLINLFFSFLSASVGEYIS